MKKKTKHLSPNEQIIYLCAFRYALGRASAVPGIIMEEIEKVRDSIDFSYLYEMECEIRHYVEQDLVDEYWKDKWAEFADEMVEYLIERKKQETEE